MPPHGSEVQLTELETEVLAPFIKRKILSDKQIAVVLWILIDKLEGKNEEASR